MLFERVEVVPGVPRHDVAVSQHDDALRRRSRGSSVYRQVGGCERGQNGGLHQEPDRESSTHAHSGRGWYLFHDFGPSMMVTMQACQGGNLRALRWGFFFV